MKIIARFYVALDVDADLTDEEIDSKIGEQARAMLAYPNSHDENVVVFEEWELLEE